MMVATTPSRPDPRHASARTALPWNVQGARPNQGRVGVGLGVAAAVAVDVAVGRGVAVGLAVGVAVGLAVGVAVGLAVGVAVGFGVAPEGPLFPDMTVSIHGVNTETRV